MSYLSLPFGLIRKEEKVKHDLPKNYGASQYIKRLPYISREDPSFQNSIIDVVNDRSDLRKFLLATSDYGRNIQENINSVVAGGKTKTDKSDLLRNFDKLKKPVFCDILPSSLLPFKKKKVYSDDEESLILSGPPSSPPQPPPRPDIL